jgi:hypothetical protein
VIKLGQGAAVVELRSRERPYPLLDTLRTEADAEKYLGGGA